MHALVMFDVDGDHAQAEVEIAGESMELHHFRDFADGFDKGVDRLARMISCFNVHLHADAEPELLRRENDDALVNDAHRFELLDALPARRRRQSDRAADFADGRCGVRLQNSQDLPVQRVHD